MERTDEENPLSTTQLINILNDEYGISARPGLLPLSAEAAEDGQKRELHGKHFRFIHLKSYPVMKEGDIVFLKRPYRGYRAVELIERLPYRWLVRVVESGLELEVYEDELTAEN